MKKSKTRTLILTAAVIVCCLCLVAVGTYALFSDSVTVSAHLQSGTLKVSLTRTAHTYNVLGSDGLLKTTAVTTESVKASEIVNAFGMNGERICPQGSAGATFEIANNDTVAFDYAVKLNVKVYDETGTEIPTENLGDVKFYEQIKITLTDNESGETVLPADATSLQVNGAHTVLVGQKQTFTVNVTFADKSADVNNLLQGKQITVDLTVIATQAVTSK